MLMLDLINLNVIDKIFNECETKPGAKAQILYINILTHHFKDKQFSDEISEFELKIKDFRGYNSFKEQISQLQKLELVSKTNEGIIFHDKWTRYIDITLVNRKIFEQSFQPIESFGDAMRKNTSMLELCAMKNRINIQVVQQLLEMFIKEQGATLQKYVDETSCNKHFLNWAPKNTENVAKPVVKSSSKILGLNE